MARDALDLAERDDDRSGRGKGYPQGQGGDARIKDKLSDAESKDLAASVASDLGKQVRADGGSANPK